MKTKILVFLIFATVFSIKVNSKTVMYSNIVKKDILQLKLASFQTIQKDDLVKSTS